MWLHGTTARLADEVFGLLLHPGADADAEDRLREALQDLAQHLTERDLREAELLAVREGGAGAFGRLLWAFQQERLSLLDRANQPNSA